MYISYSSNRAARLGSFGTLAGPGLDQKHRATTATRNVATARGPSRHRARFALFEGDKGKLLPPQFLSLYIVIAWKNSRRRSCVSLRILVVQKKPRAQLSAAVNTASFCGSYSKAAAFLGSGHEFRSAAVSLQITRRS